MRHRRAIITVAVALSALLAVATAAFAQESARRIRISMTEFKFQPSAVTVKAGQKVILTLVNEGKKKKEHELMVGREVMKGGPFGDRTDGYKTDFFHGVAVEVVEAKGVSDLMAGEAKVTGMPRMDKPAMGGHGAAKGEHGMATGGHGEAHRGFMVELEPGGTATIVFTVPANRTGKWEMGCFSEDGQHYQEGMKGTWGVTK